MKIKIILKLNDKRVADLCEIKGYSPTIMVQKEVTADRPESLGINGEVIPAGSYTKTVNETVANTQSQEDYIRQVYEWIILRDVVNSLIEKAYKDKLQERQIEEAAIRESIILDISSAIE